MMSILRLYELENGKSTFIGAGWVDGSIGAMCLLELRRWSRRGLGDLLFAVAAKGCHFVLSFCLPACLPTSEVG